MAKNKKKKITGFAVALWVLAFLILLIVLLSKKDQILTNLKATNFFERVFNKETPDFIKNHKGTASTQADLVTEEIAPVKEEKESFSQKKTKPENSSSKNDSRSSSASSDFESKIIEKNPQKFETSASISQKTESKRAEPTKAPEAKSKIAAEEKSQNTQKASSQTSASKETVSKAAQPSEAQKAVPTLKSTLYFVQIDSDGSVDLKSIQRSIPKSDSPLTDVLKNLLSGPDYSEQTKGTMTLIPKGTRLLSASVKNGVAYLNFSEEFEFNTVGVEGYLAQLKQIVYTATTFSTVSSVQFLIQGQKSDYLGSEGVFIGAPLSRSSF